MAVVRISSDVPQETAARLQMLADKTPGGTLESVAGTKLAAAMTNLPINGRFIVVSDAGLQYLEGILGGGSLLNEGDLVKKIDRLAGISFQHIRLPFTPNQLEALQAKAERQGLSVAELVERTAPRIYEQFFDLIARS